MNLRRIDVLLNKETNEEFHEGDIVKIKTKGTYGSEYIGKLVTICTLEIGIDMSEKYKSSQKVIKHEDILSIIRYSLNH